MTPNLKTDSTQQFFGFTNLFAPSIRFALSVTVSELYSWAEAYASEKTDKYLENHLISNNLTIYHPIRTMFGAHITHIGNDVPTGSCNFRAKTSREIDL